MKNYLTKLLDKMCCMHEWEVHNIMNTYPGGTIAGSNINPIRITHTLICKNCGKIKKITL